MPGDFRPLINYSRIILTRFFQIGYTCQQTLGGQLSCCPGGQLGGQFGGQSIATCPTGGQPAQALCFAVGTACQGDNYSTRLFITSEF